MTLDDRLNGDLGGDDEEWKNDSEKLGVTMQSYYNAVRMALEEVYNSNKPNPAVAILDELAPHFKPKIGRMQEWKDDVMNCLINSYRLYRYHLEEDKQMALFLTHRDGVEHVFQHGLWTRPLYTHYRLMFSPEEDGG